MDVFLPVLIALMATWGLSALRLGLLVLPPPPIQKRLQGTHKTGPSEEGTRRNGRWEEGMGDARVSPDAPALKHSHRWMRL